MIAMNLRLLLLSPILWSAACAPSESSDEERAILLAVASEVRPTIDAAFRYDWGEGWPQDYKVRLLPNRFPVPDALEEVAQAIGNASVGPFQVECDQRLQECTAAPEVAAGAIFSDLRMITPDSATVYFEFAILPPSGRTEGYGQIDEMYVVRRGETWVYVGSVTIQES
jgi:hypothetical protein